MLYKNGFAQLQRISLAVPLLRKDKSTSSLPVLTLYSKAENCSLCDDAKKALKNFNLRVHFEEVDIMCAGNEGWYERYKYDIPVIHLNGTELMRHRVFPNVLDDALNVLENQAKK